MASLDRADGRWARILTALEAGPLSFGALAARVRNREHTQKIDRDKVKRAVLAMTAEGLVAGSFKRLAITDLGRMAFAHVQSQQEPR